MSLSLMRPVVPCDLGRRAFVGGGVAAAAALVLSPRRRGARVSHAYRPFPPERVAALRAVLATPPRDLVSLARARERLSGEPRPLSALRMLLERDADLAARFFDQLIPALWTHADALLAGPEPTLPVHAAGASATATISRGVAVGWLAHLVLGTLAPPSEDHPALALRLLDGDKDDHLAKLRCILAYFDRLGARRAPGQLVVERIRLPPRGSQRWLDDTAVLTPLTVVERGTIEDQHGHLQVDFANRRLGGGVLGNGSTQEEIMFAVAPEHLLAMIVSARLADDEAIRVRGAERWSRTRGYGRSLAYAGPLEDPAPRDPDGAPDVTSVAIDAIDWSRGDPRAQFAEAALLRELDKARAGFRADAPARPVATGNWGCGVFAGDPPLKAVLQWLAASAEGRAVRYCNFGDARVGALEAFAARARQEIRTVGALWARLRAAADPDDRARLYDRLLA
jgi:hypothetical protein